MPFSNQVIVQPSVRLSLVLQLEQPDLSNLFETGNVQSTIRLTVDAFDLYNSKLRLDWWRGLSKLHHVRELEGFLSAQKVCLDRRVLSYHIIRFRHVSFDLASVE